MPNKKLRLVFSRICHRFTNLLGPPHRCDREILIANILLLVFYPVYYWLNRIILQKKGCLVHVSYSGSPGHIAFEYQLSSLLAKSNDLNVHLFARGTPVSRGMMEALGSSKDITAVNLYSSDILYFISYPLHAFSTSADKSFSITTCHSSVKVCNRKAGGFFCFSYLKLERLSNEQLLAHYNTQLESFASNLDYMTETANKLRNFLRAKDFKHPSLPLLVKQHKIAGFHYKPANSLSNNCVEAPTGEFLSAVLQFIKKNKFIAIRFCSPFEPETNIPNDLDQREPLLRSFHLSFYDQILLAAHSSFALVNASGLEILFALTFTPTLYYGGLFAHMYTLNPYSIDVPMHVYDRVNSRYLDFNEIDSLRNSDNNFLQESVRPGIRFIMPTSEQLAAALSDLLLLPTDHDRTNNEYIYPFGRDMIGRRMLNLPVDVHSESLI